MDDLTSANHLNQANKRRGVADRDCRLGLLLVLCILSAISTRARGDASSLLETLGYMAGRGELVIDPSPTPVQRDTHVCGLPSAFSSTRGGWT